jgi:cell division protein FtsB
MMVRILKIISNKFFLTAVAFLAWSLYFDQNDWLSMRQKEKELKEINGNIKFLNDETAQMNKERDALKNDQEVLERYARENYRMKRETEDIYVVDSVQ